MAAIADALRDYHACAYCGTPTPATADVDGISYCCPGCRTAHQLIESAGLGGAFGGVSDGEKPSAPRRVEQTYEVFDDVMYLREYAHRDPAGMLSVDLAIEGIHCAACLWLLEKLPRLCDGVVAARLDVAQARLNVVFDPLKTRLSAVARTLAQLGYPAHLARDGSRLVARRRQDRVMLVRMGIAFAVAANVMLLAAALYCGDRFGMQDDIRTLLRWASMVVAVPALLYSATPFFRGAIAALRTRTAHIDLALSLSLGAGFVQGVVNTVRNSGEIYFDSVTALVFALLASRFVHQRKQRQATDATELLTALTPSVAHRRDANGVVVDVATSSLRAGDIIEVRAGEAIPVDGEVLGANACVDTALLTGESEPVDVDEGCLVHAGTICIGSPLTLTATATGSQTRLAALTQRMESVASQRADIVQLADRFGLYFVIGALLLAGVTVVASWHLGGDVAIGRAIALLIVACPCALGLATPLAMSSAMASAARQRILVRTSAALERLTRVKTVIFDKTGTLTEGKLSVERWFGERTVRDAVAALEAHVDHPIAAALRAGRSIDGHVVTRVEYTPGQGVRGNVDGTDFIVGAPRWIVAQTENSGLWESMAGELAQQGFTPVLVASANQIVAVAGIADRLRDDALETVSKLQQQGYAVRLVSGDDPRVVARVARRLGIADFEAMAGPERKLDIIRDLEATAPAAMVGDGVNDAAALAAATVGIAMHGGAEASLAAADVYLARPDMVAIVDTFVGAKRASRVVAAGIAFGLVYNVIGVALAMTGVVTPLMAAILMPAASLTVVTLAHTMRTFGGRR